MPFLGSSLFSCQNEAGEKNATTDKPPKLNILILGGTSFLGPHQIAYALERGHSITTFTRGKTLPTIHQKLFEQVTQLTGDRESDLSALEDGKWDAVIDNSGRKTEWTQKSAALLKGKADLYLYTSSTGVFYPYLEDGLNEEHQPLLVEPEGIEDEDMKLEYWYGVMKATSELAARKEFGDDRTIIVRPTYMIGPADKTNRFIHWPIRLSKGGEILVPGKPEDRVQYADVRDIAEWMIRLIEEKQTGTFNAAGPQTPQTIQEFAAAAGKTFDVPASFVQIDDYEFLENQKISYLVPWIMPVGNNKFTAGIDNKKAVNAGLNFRDLKTTIKDTYDWWYSDALTDEQRDKYELDPETVLMREQKILNTWKEFPK